MEDEYRTDVETVLKWTGDVDDYEEDIIKMLTFQLKVTEPIFDQTSCRGGSAVTMGVHWNFKLNFKIIFLHKF